MNADRLPDNADDPRPAADTPRLTDSVQPEPQPDPEPQPERKRKPEREQPPDPLPTDSPKPAEPRSRQEHADPPSAEKREVPAEDEVGGGDANIAEPSGTPNDPDDKRSSSDITSQEEIKEDPSGEGPDDDSPPDGLPRHERNTSYNTEVSEGQERHNEESTDREDRPNEEANDPSSLTQAEKPPEPTDEIPAYDRPAPLTDKEWSEHVTEVRDTLDKARVAGLTTDRLYTIDPDHKEWTVERNHLQGSVVADLYERARDVPCDREAIIAGGLGGAGKTTVLTGHAGIDLSKYLTINPDDIKEEMARRGMIPNIDKLSPMEASDLAHEESSYIAKRLALRAMADGKNIIWDITMSSRASTKERINNLRDAAYARVDGVFVDIPPDISITRTELRHREGHEQWRTSQGLGGRFVPPEVIQRQLDPEWGSQNRGTYEAMKDKFSNWSIYDNSVDGRSPTLIDSSEREKPGTTRKERLT
jgi:Zeta toxin